jgi:5'(3')-deoxyribonucleotidase
MTQNKKARYDLVPPYAYNQLALVLTEGAEKRPEREWENGFKWSETTAKLERHLNAFKNGEDYDEESGLLHISHVLANASFLTEYYKIYPQGDDRRHRYLNPPKVGLDIDEVIADWLGAWRERHNIQGPITFWNFDRQIAKRFEEMKDDKDFWLNIKPRILAKDLPFEPHCYITSRSIPREWTEEWLQINNFPAVPVYSIGFGESKVEVAKKSGIEWFVDDRFTNFVELNNAGIYTFLMDCEHNKKYNVGYKRIHSLDELITRF